mmetsp:Transcript_68677/g.223516  ORF Transcript_68677/g.223516 Transcript_68677/m.223516 type:complete len:206 (+) Transcript_68677:1387-2004(+)
MRRPVHIMPQQRRRRPPWHRTRDGVSASKARASAPPASAPVSAPASATCSAPAGAESRCWEAANRPAPPAAAPASAGVSGSSAVVAKAPSSRPWQRKCRLMLLACASRLAPPSRQWCEPRWRSRSQRHRVRTGTQRWSRRQRCWKEEFCRRQRPWQPWTLGKASPWPWSPMTQPARSLRCGSSETGLCVERTTRPRPCARSATSW